MARFWRDHGASGVGVVLVICVNDAAVIAANRALPPRYALVLGPEDVVALLNAPKPQRRRIERLPARFGRTFPWVYDFSKPAGVAFFGRTRELEKLQDDANTSYAVTGPGRIGKSSLLRRHATNLRRSNDPRASRLVELDCTGLPRDDPNEVARAIAVNIGRPDTTRQTSSGVPGRHSASALRNPPLGEQEGEFMAISMSRVEDDPVQK